MAFGGPSIYIDIDMKTSHAGPGITDDEWDVFAVHSVAVLDKLGISGREKSEFRAAATNLKEDIVEVPRESEM
jgi:hemoglobin